MRVTVTSLRLLRQLESTNAGVGGERQFVRTFYAAARRGAVAANHARTARRARRGVPWRDMASKRARCSIVTLVTNCGEAWLPPPLSPIPQRPSERCR